MKMLKKILFIFVAFFGLLGLVNAEEKEWLTFDWGVNQGEYYEWNGYPAILYTQTTEVSDGYITATLSDDGYGILRKFSRSGELIWTHKKDNAFYFGSVIAYGEYIYVPYYNPWHGTYIGKYNASTGEWVEKIQLNELTPYNYDTTYVYGSEIYRKDDKLYLIYKGPVTNSNAQTDYYYGPVYLYTIDIETMELENTEDYWEVSTERKNAISNNNTELLDENLNDKIDNYIDSNFAEDTYDTYISQQLVDDNYKYNIGYVYDNQNDNYKGIVAKLNNSGEVLWVKMGTTENEKYYDAAYINNNHIAVTTISENGSKIFVFNGDGNIVETHDINKELNLVNDAGTILTLRDYSDAIVGQIVTAEGYTYVVRYIPEYEIFTKVASGNGSIDVISSSKAGEEITFKLTPEEGYVLSEVKVTDASGNEVTFKDYTFTMPSSDVIIEATFIKETTKEEKNPDTTDVAVIACIAIIVFGGIGTAYSIRKLSWLK